MHLVQRGPLLPRLGSSLRLHALGIDPREVEVRRRGFAVESPLRAARLEAVGAAFLHGYHAALAAGAGDRAVPALERVAPERRGFAYEGAGMALALLDALVPGPARRVADFLRGGGDPHAYMVHVGVGWALARLRRAAAPARARLDPLLGWLLLDGYGFHEGYFHWPRVVRDRAAPPRRLVGYERRVYDHGVGRSLWFVCGAGVARVAAAVAAFPGPRQADLWAGVGLACAYAGGAEPGELQALRAAAGPCAPMLAQGAAFAAKARERAGNPAAHTDVACAALCACTAAAAAAVTDAALAACAGGDATPGIPRYERWRCLIQSRLASRASVA